MQHQALLFPLPLDILNVPAVSLWFPRTAFLAGHFLTWDDLLRMRMMRRGRQCIQPEVSRNFNFGYQVGPSTALGALPPLLRATPPLAHVC